MKQNTKLTSETTEKILKQVLDQFNVPGDALSIGFPAEQRVCLERKDDKYYVYSVERGIKFQESKHQTEFAAHLEILYQLSSSKNEYREMRGTYIRMVKEFETQQSLLDKLTSVKTSVPTVCIGDMVCIYIATNRNSSSNIKKIYGTVINHNYKHGTGSITIRHIANGIGVEKKYSFPSPNIVKIEIVRKGRLRRQKLYTLRHQKEKVEAIKKKV